MSRYEWSKDGKTYSIGWDRPMRTFFAQVHNDDAERDADYCELWLGRNFDEYPDSESLKTMCAKLPCEVPPELEMHLLSDYMGFENADELYPLPDQITKRF